MNNSKRCKQQLGKQGELLAEKILLNKQFKILERNWRYQRYGELDIIATHTHKSLLCFIEVKTRTNHLAGRPEEAVDEKKQKQIIRLAEYYLSLHPLLQPSIIRFDVISITILNNNPWPLIYHLENAFSSS